VEVISVSLYQPITEIGSGDRALIQIVLVYFRKGPKQAKRSALCGLIETFGKRERPLSCFAEGVPFLGRERLGAATDAPQTVEQPQHFARCGVEAIPSCKDREQAFPLGSFFHRRALCFGPLADRIPPFGYPGLNEDCEGYQNKETDDAPAHRAGCQASGKRQRGHQYRYYGDFPICPVLEHSA
jgi:hypothetical protein